MSRNPKTIWGPHYVRNLTINKLDIYTTNMEQEQKRYFPKGMNSILFIGKGREVDWYFHFNQFKELGQLVLEQTLSDAKSGKNHIRRMIDRPTQAIKKINNFDSVDFKSFERAELLAYFNKFLEVVYTCSPIIYVPITVEEQLFAYAKKLLAKKYSGRELAEKWDIIVAPIEHTPILQQEIDLLKIVAKGTKDRPLREALERHRKKYCWLGMRFIENKPATIDYFLKEIERLKKGNWRQQLSGYRQLSDAREKQFNEAIKPFTPVEQRFFKLVNDYSALRHQRDLYRGTCFYYGYFLYQEFLRRFKISIDDIVNYTIDDVLQLLKSGRKLSSLEIQRRKGSFVFLLLNSKKTIISQPEQVKKFIAENVPELHETRKIHAQISGRVAYPGKVADRVKVIHLNNLHTDLKSFQKGEVMVTISTKPEYVSAMKKASAIVTDEGGITCHAAIISRELKIPCVVGTKIATQVFKDGDLIEVDADKGIVRKIE